MRRFKNVVRWKEFWSDQKQSTKMELQDVNEEEEDSRFKATGLNTGLKPTLWLKTSKHGSDYLEGFLTAVEKTLIKEAFKRRRFERKNTKTKEIYDILQRLKKSGSVCVSTNKTNSTRVINIENYKRWVSNHLLKASDLALRAKLVALFEDANCLLDKAKMKLSVQEENFVRQLLATKAVPAPKLLIKDHKTINEKGELPTRLVIPSTKFTATFSKIGAASISVCSDRKSRQI